MSGFDPPITPPGALVDAIARRGEAVLAPDGLAAFAGVRLDALDRLKPSWDDLPADDYLKDGGHYRRRRHASVVVDGEAIRRVAPRAHWQPLDYNALHGGIERWFAPIDDAVQADPAWRALVVGFGRLASTLRGAQPWFVEAHQFRITTAGGIGRPTPEGAHRDGVDLVVVALVGRSAITGGETRVFDAGGPTGLRFTLADPWTTLVLDDARVIHETTPIQPLRDGAGSDAPAGHRDTLVLTYRARGFQGPNAGPDTPSPP